jgi:hypothetical protein
MVLWAYDAARHAVQEQHEIGSLLYILSRVIINNVDTDIYAHVAMFFTLIIDSTTRSAFELG